jgi:putative ABC transport system permease protein
VALIVGTITVYRQISFAAAKDLGLDKDNIVCLRMEGLSDDYGHVKQVMGEIPGVTSVTATFNPPAWQSIGTAGLDHWEGQADRERFPMALGMADYDYLTTFGLRVVAGRGFSRDFPSDSAGAYVVNESAVRAMGLEDPIGKKLAWNQIEGQIVGVVQDFHLRPLHHKIQPFACLIVPWYNYLCLKLDGRDVPATLAQIKSRWQVIRPGQEFQYTFFDEYIGRRYAAEQRTNVIIGLFSLLAVILACLGLLSLAAYATERRTKEIGVRKVLGASAGRLAAMLAREFAVLVAISSLIGWALGYFLMSDWLERFAYRIELNWLTFVGAGLLVLVIALSTVSYYALRAARTNPVEALRYE